jgi:PilZ domain
VDRKYRTKVETALLTPFGHEDRPIKPGCEVIGAPSNQEPGRCQKYSSDETLHQFISVLLYFTLMIERRAAPRNRVMMAGTIEFEGSTITCLVRDLSISGAALDVTSSGRIPEHFTLVFQADGVHMPCRIIWCKEERIGVAFG